MSAAEGFADQLIFFITLDTGCAMRARAVGLGADKLPMPETQKPAGEARPNTESRRSRRRDARARSKQNDAPPGPRDAANDS